jgi:type IV secretory pathway VirB4 component
VSSAVLDRYMQLARRLEKYTQAGLGEVFDRPSSLCFEPGQPVGVGFRSMSLNYGADLTPAQAVVLSHVTEAVGRAAERLIVFIGEAHVLMNDPDGGQTLEQLLRRVRKYRAGVWLETQKWDDLLATPLGRTAVATAATKWVFGQEEIASDQARDVCGLDEDEAEALTPPVPGRALLISGSERGIHDVWVSEILAPFIFPVPMGGGGGRVA